ncbi:MAG: UDP-glucose/GDP-mannose dehydrogenase family protein, partial [Rickettsiales bacterium]|nr:UDP-glucose/GDP-mannose dehydrogenase family protein [Rickettsiales bacterium]
MKLAVIGTGYVGLVSGTCFAALGHEVTCIDRDASKIATLKQGGIPIYEDSLQQLVQENAAASRLHFTTDLAAGLEGAEAIFIAVGTPVSALGHGGADLSYVYAVARDIAPHLKDDAVIVVKSTVPVGTGKRLREIISELRPGLRFEMVSNPEFLREGCAVKDFMEPDRIITGTETARGKAVMEALYAPLTRQNVPLLITDIPTAELTKYAANAFLATKIAFINEMADVCEQTNADVAMLAHGMGLDHRIGQDFLAPGPGFGGSCFPKDTLA